MVFSGRHAVTARRPSLVVDEQASERQLARAVAALDSGKSAVILKGVVCLHPRQFQILCEVLDPAPLQHRCAQEYAVMVENARRALACSALGARLPVRAQYWVVVEQYGAAAAEPLWVEPPRCWT